MTPDDPRLAEAREEAKRISACVRGPATCRDVGIDPLLWCVGCLISGLLDALSAAEQRAPTTITRVELPSGPVSAPCAIEGCRYTALEQVKAAHAEELADLQVSYQREIRSRSEAEQAKADAEARAARADERLNDYHLSARDVEEPCPRCKGWGNVLYANTATWHYGLGGCRMTPGPCDRCWGSGDARKPWVSHREFEEMRNRLKGLDEKWPR